MRPEVITVFQEFCHEHPLKHLLYDELKDHSNIFYENLYACEWDEIFFPFTRISIIISMYLLTDLETIIILFK